MSRRFSFSSQILIASCVLALAACDDGPVLTDNDAGADGAIPMLDGGASDAGSMDGGTAPDAGPPDGGVDAGPPCEELEVPAPTDPANGGWGVDFNNPGVSGGAGFNAGVAAIALGADGKAYVGGNFTTAGYTPASNVAAWDPAGGWQALGDGLPNAVSQLTFGSDGSLYAVHGFAYPNTNYRIARWDGTSWSTFDEANGTISDLEVVGDILFAVGSFTEIGGEEHAGVAYHDGTAWQGYADLAPDRGVQSVSATGPDDVCIGGQFSDLGVIAAVSAACWNGSTWEARSLPPPPDRPTFPPLPGMWNVLDLQRDPSDGALFAAGNFRDIMDSTSGGGIARWSGTEWEFIGGGVMEYGPGGDGSVSSMAITSSGLYVAGTFRFANASEDPLTEVNDVARWDGTRWQPLSGGVFGESAIGFPGSRSGAAGVVAATPDGGSIFFGGSMNRADTLAVGGVVRWDGTYWRGLRAPGERYYGLSGEASAFGRRGTCEIYVGGHFAYAGETRADSIARFTREGGYEALGDGLLGTVANIQVTQAGLVYAAGGFTDPSGTRLRNLAVWDGTEWSSVGGGVGDPTDPFQIARTLAIHEGGAPDGGDIVYVAGNIDYLGGERASGFGMWDGSEWTDLGVLFRGHESPIRPGEYNDARFNALMVDPETGDLIVAGSFSAVGRDDTFIETSNVVRWDGSAWHPYGDGIGDREGSVTAATLWNGRVTVARQYQNDEPRRFAVWTGSEWEAVGTDQPGFTTTSQIAGIGNALFAAGNWSGGRHVAVFDGSEWHALGAGVSDGAEAVLPIEGGVLFGGVFNRAGETGSGGIAFWQYAE